MKRKITAGELSKILKEHERWYDTDEDEGEKVDLRYANLSYANLSRANLYKAKLFGTDLSGADLTVTSLSGANLTQVLGLSINKLSKVKTLYETKIDPELKKQVKDEYPHLLEEPKP